MLITRLKSNGDLLLHEIHEVLPSFDTASNIDDTYQLDDSMQFDDSAGLEKLVSYLFGITTSLIPVTGFSIDPNGHVLSPKFVEGNLNKLSRSQLITKGLIIEGGI